jgi:hypothetical protein
MKMTTHELKIWPQYFQPLIECRKTFELRKTDRDYQVDDEIWFREWDPKTETYTGREAEATIRYILDGQMAIPNLCLMSIKLCSVLNKRVSTVLEEQRQGGH